MAARTVPKLEAQVVAMIAAGASLTATQEATGVNYETIKKIKSRNKVKKGDALKALSARYTENLIDILSSDAIKQQSAKLLLDSFLITQELQAKAYSILGSIPSTAKDASEAGKAARAIAAIATTVKLANDSHRALLSLGAKPEESEELPVLIVREMLDEEIEEIRDNQEKLAKAQGIPLNQ